MHLPPPLSASSIAPAPRRPRTKTWLVVFAGAVALIAAGICIPVARAADLPQLQRVDGWVVTEFYQYPEKFNRAWRDLSEPYKTKKLCEEMARLYVGEANGSRIRCTPVNDVRMVWR